MPGRAACQSRSRLGAPAVQSASPMNELLRNCSNCGGRIEHAADGRSIACPYCGSGASVSIDPRALAAGIAADAKSLHAGFDRLLEVFRSTLPDRTAVHESGMLFKKVTGFDIELEEFTFRMKRESGRVIAQCVTTVRGITLKTETMSLEQWVTALAEKLSAMAG